MQTYRVCVRQNCPKTIVVLVVLTLAGLESSTYIIHGVYSLGRCGYNLHSHSGCHYDLHDEGICSYGQRLRQVLSNGMLHMPMHP